MKHQFAVFIGRFSPFTLAHQILLKKALEVAEKAIVVIGSHNRARDIKNPWSSDERQAMIELVLSPEEKGKIIFVKVKDYLYSDTSWICDVQNKIAEVADDAEDIALVGFESDRSSYYLDLFPKWKYYSCPTKHDFHATKIREYLFTHDAAYKGCVHSAVGSHLEGWTKTETFKTLKEEFDFLAEYKEKFRGSPFPPTFCTVDACVLKSGHILLVRRKGKLGKGLLALPGGFLNQNENTTDGAIRELREETGIKISKEDLKKSIVDSKVFDYPTRSLRGRTLTFAVMINLGAGPLDKVKGSDDAEKAFWIPLNEVLQREAEFFEDHAFIIQKFVFRN
jgi:bifunctional NMN adenylyltransferase/nudix hydrolase